MQILKQNIIWIATFCSLLLVAIFVDNAFAQQSSSTNYSVNEVIFSAGGTMESTSASYSIKATIGEMAVGNLKSTTFQAYGGFETTDTPFLEAGTSASNIDLGVLSVSSTATANATFYVRTYLASGYVVSTVGLPTSESGNTLAPMTTAAAPSIGTEQFGINLVANTSPTTFGADPEQIPDSSFSFGQVASGYDTANQFKYNEDDTIAYSDSSSGRTDYTISYIYNMGVVTQAGTYVLKHTIVVTPTY